MNKKFKKAVSGLAALFCLVNISSMPAFAAGYDVIREPWLDALMGSEHIDFGDSGFDKPLLLYPTVFKNGTATLYEKTYIDPGYEVTFYCDTMYKVNYNGDAITEKKTADSFSFTPSYEGENVSIPDFEGAYWIEDFDKILFYPNEWTWCENENLEYKASNKYFEEPNYVTFLGDLYGYGYYDWADYESIYVRNEYDLPSSETMTSYKYYNGVSTAFCNRKAGVIDEDDNIIVPFEYDMILPVANEDGYTWVLKDGKWGIIKVNTTDVSVTLNNNRIEFDQTPLVINSRTLVPLRAIFEALEATVDWNGETKTITSVKGDTVVTMTLDKNEMFKNGEKITLDVAPTAVGERTLVPVRAISEAFDCKVAWDGGSNTVVIEK